MRWTGWWIWVVHEGCIWTRICSLCEQVPYQHTLFPLTRLTETLGELDLICWSALLLAVWSLSQRFLNAFSSDSWNWTHWNGSQWAQFKKVPWFPEKKLSCWQPCLDRADSWTFLEPLIYLWEKRYSIHIVSLSGATDTLNECGRLEWVLQSRQVLTMPYVDITS